ncbi:MAG: AraC family transcriptional regulator, partial [Planctomycetota bacterium]
DSLMELIFLQSVASAQALANTGQVGETLPSPAMSDEQIGPVLREIRVFPAKPWTLPMMAKRAKLSRSAFADRFRRLVGQSPLQYLTDVRMTLACKLLTTEALSVSTIATMVGYENGSSFSNSFKKWSQQSPLAFRRSRRSYER